MKRKPDCVFNVTRDGRVYKAGYSMSIDTQKLRKAGWLSACNDQITHRIRVFLKERK